MNPASTLADERNLIDVLLAEQRTLTAVERFARRHDSSDRPAQSRYYEDLIPLSKPAPGQQYAFAVDLDACTGCKACVSACHSLNGLEENETWRDVGLLIGAHSGEPYLQTITTACHHCLEPACLEGCPVMAYEKDADTGIVRHLDDQCIGCQYCTLKCPYGVPKYSERLGIVRKCDMCHDRLAVGEAPACVQACPHEAIAIRLIDVAEVSAAATPGSRMVADAFDSSYTKPTTIFHSWKEAPATAHAADAHRLHLEHAHWPLIIMLVLSQMATGLFIAMALGRTAEFPLAAAGFVALNAGLFAALFHLGRPLGAWRFFLGLRTSWMSREILAFSLMAAAAGPALGAAFFLPGSWITSALAAATGALGVIAVFTSAMIYVDTRRALWSPIHSFTRFYGATAVLGAAGAAVVFGLLGLASAMKAALVVSMTAQAIVTTFDFTAYHTARRTRLSALTLRSLLPWLMPARGILSATSLLFSAMAITTSWHWAIPALLASIAAQTLERFAFFTTVRAPKMPGGIA
jgi:Fe-S-cluster-containing dehydrogenase component/DMSO reductase anchor subunit